jgi:hypothetical protein
VLCRSRAAAAAIVVGLVFGLTSAACNKKGDPKPQHRERSPTRDVDCKDGERPRAFFYPAENRTDYGPDDPKADGCVIIVPDHLFCCPDVKRPSDR